jgi:hypothetical protein
LANLTPFTLQRLIAGAGAGAGAGASAGGAQVGLYPIVTSQYSSTTSYRVSYHIRSLFF